MAKEKKPKESSNLLDNPEYKDMSLLEKRKLAQQKLASSVFKKYGKGSMTKASDHVDIPRLCTNILNMDLALGGGIGVGRITMIKGSESSSKTTIAYRLVADSQRRSAQTNKYLFEKGLKGDDLVPNNCLYIDLEGAFDSNWAAQNGVNVSELSVSRLTTAEDAGDFIQQALESGIYNTVVIDSLAQMISEDEFEGSLKEFNVGKTARLNNSLFRKMQLVLNQFHAINPKGLSPTIIIINQPRKSMTLYGPNEVLPGGEAQKFYPSTIIKMSGNKVNFYDKDNTLPRASEFNFKIEKNKLSPPRIEGSYELALVDDPDGEFKKAEVIERKFLIEQAEAVGIFSKTEKNHWICSGEEFKTKGEMLEKFLGTLNSQLMIRQAIINAHFPKK